MELSEMVSAFLDEVEEQLETLETKIVQLEQSPQSDEAVQAIFRAAHTIKGASAVMEFHLMKDLTHYMESVLDEVRSHRLKVDTMLVNLLFACLDALRDLRDAFIKGDLSSFDISPITAGLQHFLETGESFAAIPSELDTFEEIAAGMSDQLEQYLESGHAVYRVEVYFADDVLIKMARAKIVMRALEQLGEILFSIPDIDGSALLDHEWNQLFLCLMTTEGEEAVRKTAESCSEVKWVTVSGWSREFELAGHSGPVQGASPVSDVSLKTTAQTAEKPSNVTVLPTVPQQTIRVDVERIENLMNLVGELVIDKTRIQQIGETLRRKYSNVEELKDLGTIVGHLNRTIGDLQENVMMTRMLPIEKIFNRFPRMVRTLANQLGKEVELVVEGQDTQLDRALIDEIADPLIHLVRNAVDHGLELPQERTSQGKEQKGRLKIAAEHVENQILIVVEDDGQGIEPEKLRRSAIEKGILSAEDAGSLTDLEAQNLVFRPGFSTARQVSDISGRGVGMDIVRANIERLQGTIEIHSTPLRGTRFEVKLPLTLAIIRGLLVGVRTQTFIIPISTVIEIVREGEGEIERMNGKTVLLIRGQALPVFWLHDRFGIPRHQKSKKHISVVVVGIGNRRMGIIVDSLKGNQEIVKKSLGTFVGQAHGIAGCTILGDGRTAMIVDVADLFAQIS